MRSEKREARSEMRALSRDLINRQPCVSSRLNTFPKSAFRYRSAVTLIELLITVTIIAILATAFLGASRSAMEHSRAARTKTTIGKLHGLLMDRWQSYETRRVDVNPQITLAIKNAGFSGRVRGQMNMDVRLLALRELMKLEMPDRWSDLTGSDNSSVAPVYPFTLVDLSSLTKSYLRRYQTNPIPSLENQGAECLYMIIMLATADGEARTLFSQQDIGDTDDDGAPEFLDGWGNPISFIRWPVGFVEEGLSSLMSADADADHDPFDPFRRDQEGVTLPTFMSYPLVLRNHIDSIRNRNEQGFSAYRLVPLIYSPGPDGKLAILTNNTTIVELDPYIETQVGSVGSPIVENGVESTEHIDNIHNHLQDNR